VATESAIILSVKFARIEPMRSGHLDAVIGESALQRVQAVDAIETQSSGFTGQDCRFFGRVFEERGLIRGRACQVHCKRKTRMMRHPDIEAASGDGEA